jgi:hypothetical protein
MTSINVHRSSEFMARCLVLFLFLGGACAMTWQQAANPKAYTVCASGCDYTAIQAALDDAAFQAGSVIQVKDAVHTEADIVLRVDATIQGNGAEQTIVQAHEQPKGVKLRVFDIEQGVTAVIRDMTIRHGNPTKTPQDGGGIRNLGSLRLENVVVSDNSGSAGGGVSNEGELTMLNTTIAHNEARGGASGIECQTGGGMKILTGSVTMINSTIRDNRARGKGGGVHLACKGKLTMINSTVSGNYSVQNGGGVYVDGVANFFHSTISNNTAKSGGGVYLDGSREQGFVHGLMNYKNTLIAGNVAEIPNFGITDCAIGDTGSLGISQGNFVGDGTCNPAFSGDPLLAPLSAPLALTAAESDQTYAPLMVHALLPGSPLIDAVSKGACGLKTDQRGLSRPQGKGCDIGAYEMEQRSAFGNPYLVLIIVAGVVLALMALGAIAWRRTRKSQV